MVGINWLMDDLFSGTKAVDQKLRFDEQGLHEWFSKNLSEFGSIEKIEQFKGGQSNPTYKITIANKNLFSRKPPGKLLPSAHAVDREYKVITALNSTDVPVLGHLVSVKMKKLLVPVLRNGIFGWKNLLGFTA